MKTDTSMRLRTRDAAAYLAISPRTLEKYRLTGEGPPFLKIGRAVVYDSADLDAWLADKVRQSTAENSIIS